MTATELNLAHGPNFRDLGGYRTEDNRVLRAHKLIRSARLDWLTPSDLDALVAYGLRIDVDFRSPEERTAAPDPVPAGVTYAFLPVLPTDETQASKAADQLRRSRFATDPQGGFKNMVRLYREMPRHQSAQKAYRDFFDLMLANDQAGQALLFHCTAGKDRTGMGAVLALTALGVPAATVRADYLASNRFLAGKTREMLAAVSAKGGTSALLASTKALASVDEAYLDAAIATFNEDFGGLDNYLTNTLHVTPAQRQDLQRLYLA
ncbi:tyrosine-protein phosphatase [Lacticaseibacillus kribbianus]|uniref:tyrosine-protein phosphatase n=1 Tax=Lacticaseibacillus kribbianus TaxID=2926292 RepID=UPI001CD29A70|nr:tyrosine-protein phosphatase [Lacticaseibacillus kribbianus]